MSLDRSSHKRCSCWCCCKDSPNLEFYEEKVKLLSEKFEVQRKAALQQPVGTVFVTFKTHQMTNDVHKRFNRGTFALWKPKLQKSTLDKYLRTKKWNVVHAPEEEDIYWETLGETKGAKGYYYYKIKYAVVNIGLLIFLLFLSTPRTYLILFSCLHLNGKYIFKTFIPIENIVIIFIFC